MHELSIAIDVGRIAAEQAGPAGAGSVRTVALEVGTDAGVEFDNLEFCLEAVLSTPPFRAARALIERRAGNELRVAYLEIDDGHPDD